MRSPSNVMAPVDLTKPVSASMKSSCSAVGTDEADELAGVDL
jgi:hypothetical protein